MSRPSCPNCGKQLQYCSTNVYAPREAPHSAHPMRNWRYTGNLVVTFKRYVDVRLEDGTLDRRLYSVCVWDGESYLARNGHFCSIKCAAQYGQRSYERTKANKSLRVAA